MNEINTKICTCCKEEKSIDKFAFTKARNHYHPNVDLVRINVQINDA